MQELARNPWIQSIVGGLAVAFIIWAARRVFGRKRGPGVDALASAASRSRIDGDVEALAEASDSPSAEVTARSKAGKQSQVGGKVSATARLGSNASK